jgi:hypothetical protein
MDLNFNQEEIARGINRFTSSENITGSINETYIHSPGELTLEQANNHLKWGYYNEYQIEDPRQGTGEAIIIYQMTENEAGKQISDIVKVHSKSFDWRMTLRGNNPNIVHQFYSLLNTVYPDINKDEVLNSLTNKYIMFPLYDPSSIKQFYDQYGYILTIPQGDFDKNDYINKDHRIQLLWTNYVLSLPPHLQGDGIELLEDFKKNRNELVLWMQLLEKNNKDLTKLNDYSERIKGEKGIINQARHFAKITIDNGNNYARNGKIVPLPKVIGNNIRNFIYKENGTSLYALIKEMKKSKNSTLPTTDSSHH